MMLYEIPQSAASFQRDAGGIRKRTGTGRTEPNQTVQFWNQPEPDSETNRTEADRATTRPKNAGRTASNREIESSEPNRTEPKHC